LRALCKPKLLILDEMGYVPLDRLVAQFLFQLVSRRYLKGGSIIAPPHQHVTAQGRITANAMILKVGLIRREADDPHQVVAEGQGDIDPAACWDEAWSLVP
jgi:ABC-type branched-subunit amino acid transport system ATPase component